jgi:hypothetical protein
MMPQMPSIKSSTVVGNSEASSSFSEGSEDSMSSDLSADLGAPSHLADDFQKPSIVSPDDSNFSEKKIPLAPKKGIEVVATMKGFYNQMRYREGDKFLIRSTEEFGEWFKCVDPALEKQRVLFIKEKKARK